MRVDEGLGGATAVGAIAVGLAAFLALASGCLVDGDGTVVDVEADVALLGLVGLRASGGFGGGAVRFGGGGMDWGRVEDWQLAVRPFACAAAAIVDYWLCFI